jgi:hypothetical protein
MFSPQQYLLLIATAGRLEDLFPQQTPEHWYLRSLGAEMLGRPDGVAGNGIPYSIDNGRVNVGDAAAAYKQATGQLPSVLVDKHSNYFRKRITAQTKIVTFAPGVLDYLLGGTSVLPGRTRPHACLSAGSVMPLRTHRLPPVHVLSMLATLAVPAGQQASRASGDSSAAPKAPPQQKKAAPMPGELGSFLCNNMCSILSSPVAGHVWGAV